MSGTKAVWSEQCNFTKPNFDRFMQWLIDNGGFNDIYIMTGYRVTARIHGAVGPITTFRLSRHDVVAIARIVSRNEQIESKTASGEADDPIYIHYDSGQRGVQHRFRCNITGIRAFGGGSGIKIVIRQIAQQAGTPEELGIEPEILENFAPKNGLVIISGPTGSGKSTTFASCLGYLCVRNDRDLVIGTCEAPIEFTFDHLEMDRVLIYQTTIDEVGGDLKTFDAGVRASLRSGTSGTVIGELRDLETIRSALTASNTGQIVWGTLHVNAIKDMPSRIVNVFPTAEQNKVRVEFFANCRFLMCQILVECIKPGIPRVPVKEWLQVTEEMREQLITADDSLQVSLLKKFVAEHGMPKSRYAKRLLDDGFISSETYHFVADGE